MRPQVGKDKILDAALNLFSEQGFHQTPVDQIARKAGVSKGLTYNYFESKDALLAAIIDRASERMTAVAGGKNPQGGYQIALRDFLARLRRMLKEEQPLLRFQLNLLFDPSLQPVVGDALRARVENLMDTTVALLESSGVRNPEHHARHLVAEIDGLALHFLHLFEDYPLDEMLVSLYEKYKDIGK